MKITLIGPVPPYRGGISHYTYTLFQELNAGEHEVQLVSFKRQYPRWLYPGESDRSPGNDNIQVEGTHYWLDSLNPFTWLSSFLRTRKFGPETVIIPWWTPFWAPAWIVLGLLNRLFLRCPLVYHCHNVLPHDPKRWHPWITRAVLRWGDRFVVASDEQAAELTVLLPESDIRVCPLPANTLLAETVVSRDLARERLNLKDDARVLLFFGIVRAYKGLHVLLDALPKVRAVLLDVRLVIAGEFWDAKSDYEQHIESLELENYVDIHDGYIPDTEVPVYFSAADVLVAPYLNVTGSAVAKMAHPFGLPVVTTWETVDNGTIVFTAQPGDANSLAQVLIAALTEGCHQTAGAGRADDTSWSVLVNALLGKTPCE